MSTLELRRLWRAHRDECERVSAERERIEEEHEQRWQHMLLAWVRGHARYPRFVAPELPEMPSFPEECRDMTCGAKTRAGTPCKRKDLYGGNGRCRLHGGLSTGPRTKRGKRKSARNGRQPKTKRTP